MGYAYLVLALFAGTAKGYCGKKTSGYTNSFRLSVLANTLRMLLCIFIGFAVVLLEGNLPFILPDGKVLLISALGGISTAVFSALWFILVRKNAYMLMDVFYMLGVLVPLSLCALLFSETIRIPQWIGLVILFIATFIMCSYNNSIKGNLSLPTLLLLILSGVLSGLADFSQKLFIKTAPDTPASVFNLYTYLFAFTTLILIYPTLKRDNCEHPRNTFRSIWIHIAIMALCLFLNSYFKTLAAGTLSTVEIYPFMQGSSLVLSSMMSAVLFREKLTATAIIGIVIAFIGLLVINLS